MFNRMVGRAQANNARGTGHISSSPTDINAGAGQSGNIGGGAIPIGNIAVYPDPNTEGYIKFAYSGNGTIYTIIKTVGRKFAYIPRFVYQIKDPVAARSYKHLMKTLAPFDSKKPAQYREMKELFTKAYDETVVYNPLSELMERPNPMQGQDSFLETCGLYYEAAGEAIIWCNRGTDMDDLPLIDGPILEMWVLPPQYMEMVPDPLNVWGALGWVFNVAGKRIPIDLENIIHVKQPNLNFDGVTREHMRGMSALRPGNKKLTEDESSTDASVAMNQNEGAKGVLVDATPNAVLTPTRETNIRNAVDRKINNRDTRGAVAVLTGQFSYLDFSATAVEMDLELRKDNIFDRLCNLIGVPPDLFKTGQTYQNIMQARKDFITQKIIPMCCQFRDEFNRVLLPAFNLNKKIYTTDIDITLIPELQDDMSQMVTSLNVAWWMSPNEKRKEMNMEESDEEGADDIWIPNTYVRMEDAAQPMDMLNSFDQNGNPVPPGSPRAVGAGGGLSNAEPDMNDDTSPGKGAKTPTPSGDDETTGAYGNGGKNKKPK